MTTPEPTQPDIEEAPVFNPPEPLYVQPTLFDDPSEGFVTQWAEGVEPPSE